MFNKSLLTIAMAIGLASLPAGSAVAACYDAKIVARPVEQVPSEIGDCGDDCIIMSWP